MALPSGVRLTMMVAALGVLAAACGGGTDASDPPPTSVVATTSPATTEASPATTIATPAASTLPQPTAPSQTTVAPTATSTAATTADEAAVKAAVIAGYELYRKGFFDCSAHPGSCMTETFLLAGSPAEGKFRSYFADLATRGWFGVQNPGVDRYEVERFDRQERDDQMAVTVCTIDGGTIYDSSGTPGRDDDKIVDDRITATRTTWLLTQTPAGWRVATSILLNEGEGTTCGH
jgi:hypothetical protein